MAGGNGGVSAGLGHVSSSICGLSGDLYGCGGEQTELHRWVELSVDVNDNLCVWEARNDTLEFLEK